MATIEPLLCYISRHDEYVVLEFIINTRDGTSFLAFKRYNDSINMITISDICLDFLHDRLKIDKDKILEAFGSLKLPNNCHIIPWDIYPEIAVDSKHIDTIFETIELIGDWWFESINKLKEIEFPYRILINSVKVCNEIKFKE